MKILYAIFLSSLFILQSISHSPYFTQLTVDIIHEFSICHCIFLANLGSISVMKKFSSENIPIGYLNYDQLIDFVNVTDSVYFRTAIIFTEKNLQQLERISEIFKPVCKRVYFCQYRELSEIQCFQGINLEKNYKMSKFVWFVFLEGSHKFYPQNLHISYHCEFYIIQKINATFYRLSEVYSAKNNSFSSDVGTWSPDNLKITNISLYNRRINLNGTIFNIVHLPIDV